MIKDQIDNAQKVTDDANQLKTDYEKKLEVAKDEADKIIVEARQRSEKERAKAIETTQQETQDMMERARGNIEREQENARKAVQADIARLAIAAAEKIVKTGSIMANTKEIQDRIKSINDTLKITNAMYFDKFLENKTYLCNIIKHI